MAKVCLQFSRDRGIFGALIGWGTWSWVSHVDFIIEHQGVELLLGANGKGGVLIRGAEAVRRDAKRYEIYEVNIATEDAVRDIHRTALQLMGAKYDWTGILGFIRRKPLQNKKKWFCSEFIAYCMRQHGYNLVNEVDHRISPRDLITSTKLVKVD